MLQIEQKPCLNLQHQEPLVEPSLNPQTGVGAGAGEPGDDGFELAFAEFPDIGRQRSSPPAARATWALWCGEFDPAQLLAAIRRYKAEDPDVRRGVCLAFERWFSTERFRHWLGEGSHVEAAATTPRTGFAGPAELRALIVRAVSNGEAFARSYFDPAAWDEATNTLTPATSMAAQRLGEVRRVFRDYGAQIGAPVAAIRAAGGKA